MSDGARCKERPILFSGEMVRALLQGDKTQTRRLVEVPVCVNKAQGGANLVWYGDFGTRKPCRYGEPGDRLWVRENILQSQRGHTLPSGEYVSTWSNEKVEYLADVPTPKRRYLHPEVQGSAYMQSRPSIHMPRWASRILLEIVAVRIEQLKDITDEDARAEGYPRNPCGHSLTAAGLAAMTPRQWFCEAWFRINGADSWNSNPLVWVLDFKVLKGGAA